MLAFSPLPASGGLGGAPIVIATDTANPLNELTIILDDVTTPGFVTATITTKVDGTPDQTTQVFDFSDIFFSAANDTDGSIVNKVSLWTSYEANLVGLEAAPSDDADVGLSTNWLISNPFGGALGTVVVDLFNADALTVTGGVLGGGISTIRGEFESPTLAPDIDPSNPDTYANISLYSGVGIGDDDSGDPVVASALTLKSQTGGISLSQDVFTRFDLTLEAAQDISLSGLVEVQEGDVSLFSSSGSIAVLGLVHAMAGSITIDSDCDEVFITRLCAFDDININAPQGLLVETELRTESGSITVIAAAGPVTLFDTFAGDSIQVDSAQTVLLSGQLQTESGNILVVSDTIVNIAAPILSGDSITIEGTLGINDFLSGGVTEVEIISSGGFYEFAIVDIAPPASGAGRAALARAIITPVTIDPVTGRVSGGQITGIQILDRGFGYAPDERPVVTIIGSPERSFEFQPALLGADPIQVTIPAGDGCTAFARVTPVPSALIAVNDVTLLSSHDISLGSFIQANQGDIAVTTVSGTLNFTGLLHAVDGDISLEAQAGAANVQQLNAGNDVSVTTHNSLTAVGTVKAGGNIFTQSQASQVTVRDLFANGSLDVRGYSGVTLAEPASGGFITTTDGDIAISSEAGSIEIAAAVNAVSGAVSINAHQDVRQAIGSGILRIELLNGGLIESDGVPTVEILINPPAIGGKAATAVAELRDLGPVDPPNNQPRFWTIERIVLVDGGNGYALRESPDITIVGMPNAAARAIGPGVSQSLVAEADFTIRAGNNIELVSVVRANTGDISFTAIDGALALGTQGQAVHAVQGSISLQSNAGGASAQRLTAGTNVNVLTMRDVELKGSIDAPTGTVTIESKAGQATIEQITSGRDVSVITLRDIAIAGRTYSATGDVFVAAQSGAIVVQQGIHAILGSISISAGLGTDQLYAATVRNLEAGADLSVTSSGGLAVRNTILSTGGAITLTSNSDSVDLRTANLHAMAGEIKIIAHGAVTQPSSSGIDAITLLSSGQFIGDQPPEVQVSIEPPAGGGQQATAVANVDIIGFLPPGGSAIIFQPDGPTVIAPDGSELIWGIVAITIVTSGSGYAAFETPAVTISGMPNAAAAVVGSGTFPTNIIGKTDVWIEAGADIRLTTIVRSDEGDISIRSTDGDLALSQENQSLHTLGGSILLESIAGKVEYQRIIAGQNITLRSHDTLTINNQLTTNGGDVTLASTGADVVIDANVLAADTIAVSAKSGISQDGGILKANDLRVSNITPTPITLGNTANDVERFAATNVGDVTFADANDFRVGVETSGAMGVEVSGAAVNLTAPGTIRVVAGIQARSLAIAAPEVEFVTTSTADSTATAFTGRLRDMIAISNQNTDRQAGHFMVFDEDGYAMSEISVAAVLPQFTRAVAFEGGRVHDTVTAGRLGIRGQANVPSGLSFGAGSAGSTIRGAAVYGFTGGSAIMVESGRNTIENMYVGMRADGTSAIADRNRVGVNVTGIRANSNTIGSFVFDDTTIDRTVNRFAGNTDAAIVVQRGASSNLIAGNVVGVDGLTPNRTGIRIDGGSGNRIGTADEVTYDPTPTPSNQIRGNTHYGIEIRNVRGAATVVENNVVAGNATKAGNGAHGIGVLNSMNVVIGGSSELARNQIFSQIGGSGVHLSGSSKVSIVGNHIGTEGYHLTADSANPPGLGNGRHGIDVFGRSRDVEITANRIVDNGGSGVAIAAGSTGVVLARNEIGVFTHPVTGTVHGAGNKADGVTITAANGNVVGAGNLIGFNTGSGVRVENSVAAGLPTGNRVFGSEIFGNTGHGVHVVGSSRQTVGGIGADDGNIVKENLLDGVRIEADPRIRASAAPHGNVVTGNFLGTNDNEEIDRSWGNRFGVSVVNGTNNTIADNIVMNNRSGGVEIAGGTGNTVGGSTAAVGNFIGYNLADGVFIHDQASTQQNVGVVGTTITNSGAGYNASRTSVIFTAPAAAGGVPARGVAIISADGRVTGIRLTASGTGYVVGEPVSVTIFDPQATTQATATVTLGTIQGVSSVSRQHTVSGNLIEGNNGVGVYVKGDRVTEVTIGQSLSGSTPVGAGNTIAYHDVGVMVDAASRVGTQGNNYQDNDSPIELVNGANIPVGLAALDLINLASFVSGRNQTTVTGQLVNAGSLHQYWVDVYSTPHWDMEYDANGNPDGHQMRQFLGRALITTDANGRADLNLAISQAVEVGDYVSVKITSARFEAGTTVGIFHAQVRHSLATVPTPAPRNSTPTPVQPTPPSTTNPPPTRGPVPPSRT